MDELEYRLEKRKVDAFEKIANALMIIAQKDQGWLLIKKEARKKRR